MKTIRYLAFMLSLTTMSLAAEPQNINLDELGENFQLVGKLHVPLGEVVILEGVVENGPSVGYEGGENLRVQSIRGEYTQEDIQIVIEPFFCTWGQKKPMGGIKLPVLEVGATYEMEGYETGEFVGVPGEVFERGTKPIQTTRHYFRERFVVTKAKRIERIVFGPQMFEGRRALIQGTAKSADGKAYMIGNGWAVEVLTNSSWSTHVEGKLIETFGMYNPDEGLYDEKKKQKSFMLLDGTWRLVNLDDQVGHEVKLRGRARSLNGIWWFIYRDTHLYVEDMQDLPGWTNGNFLRPMEITGRLERASLPRLDQISIKSDRDLREYFIVRNAGWKPLPSLLSPERPFRKVEKSEKAIDSEKK